MDYSIRIIKGNPMYNLIGIISKKTNKKCFYWTNKNTKRITEVIVVLNNNNIRNIKDNQVCLSLNGINDINSQKEFIKAFCDQLRASGIDEKTVTFIFVISDRKEGLTVKSINDELGLNGKVLLSNNKAQIPAANNDAKEKEKEQKLNNEDELKGKSNIVDITTYNNNLRGNVVLNTENQVAYDISKKNLTMNELIKAKYKEISKNDPAQMEILLSMDPVEAQKHLMELVTMDLKSHDAREDTTDTTLGVTVNNDPNKKSDITIYEKDGKNTIKKEIESTKIDMNNSESSNKTNSSNVISIQSKETIKPRKNPVREDTMIFEKPPATDNVVSMEKSKHKAKTRTLKPPKNTERSAAFVNIPVIIFVISIILLIASGVIWFITK